MKHPFRYTAALLLFILVVSIIAGCAKQASPEGGPYDMIAPKLIRSTPLNEATHSTGKKIKLTFDENVKIEKQNEKVFFSPPQKTPPRITHGTGKNIIIYYEDDLKPNTTYTINFTDAIVDLNEGNPLEGLVFAFSTGATIDTMQIRGQVIDARSLAPVPNILVGVHPQGSDTLFQKSPLLRVAQTDSKGAFTITHLAPGEYRLFALNDLDHSFSYSQRSEGFAFLDHSVSAVPPLQTHNHTEREETDSIHPIETDTAQLKDEIPQKEPIISQKQEEHLLFYSVDLPKKQLLQKSNRPDSLRLVFNFSAPIDSLPSAHILNMGAMPRTLSLIALNAERTEVTYWLPDSTLYRQDSLQVQLKYRATDSVENTHWRTDTLTLISRKNNPSSNKASLREQIKAAVAGASGDSIEKATPLSRLLTVEQRKNNAWYKGSPRDTVRFVASEPIASVDSTRLQLFSVKDSIETPQPFTMRKVPLDPCAIDLITNYSYGTNYKFVIDSVAMQGIYGGSNPKETYSFGVEGEDKFGSLKLSLQNLPKGGMLHIDLLDEKNQVLDSLSLTDSTLVINNLPPAQYFVRLWVDLNQNGQWDPASYPTKQQAEPVYFYPAALTIQGKFVSEESWDLEKTPITQQRPSSMQSPFADAKNNQQKTERKDLNEEYIQRMRERYGNKWNPSEKDRKTLGLPTRAEEHAQREAEKLEKEKKMPAKANR